MMIVEFDKSHVQWMLMSFKAQIVSFSKIEASDTKYYQHAFLKNEMLKELVQCLEKATEHDGV